MVELEPLIVTGARSNRAANRFCIAPGDISEELQSVYTEAELTSAAFDGVDYPFLLTVRRSRTVLNSSYRQMSFAQKRMADNPLWMHPDDVAACALVAGERVSIASPFGKISGLLEEDKTMRAGTVSMCHGWGGNGGYREGIEDDHVGSAINDLIPSDQRYEKINGMPWFSALPVRINAL
jgi:anaerobic selenocysteine-containing dehydrogenase